VEVLTAQQSPGPDSGRNTGSHPGADSDSEIRPAVAEAVSTAISALVTAAVTQAFREEWGRVVATLIRVTGDWDLAEECAQEAFAVALTQWQSDGIPRRPGAWLTTVARRTALNRLRRSSTETVKLREVAVTTEPPAIQPWGDDDIPDDRLRLIFTCAHPALPLAARVALTLRTLAGLTTAEIARAFLVPEPTRRSAWSAPSRRSASPASPMRCRSARRSPPGSTACSR